MFHLLFVIELGNIVSLSSVAIYDVATLNPVLAVTNCSGPNLERSGVPSGISAPLGVLVF